MADAQIAIIDGDPTQIAVIDGDQTQIVMAPGENPAIVTAIPGPQGPAGAVAAAIDGSAALPSIAFASDTDTGLYRVGANQLGVSTGGTQRLVIDASGQIEATSLGSAASPTWTFVGDPDTGVFSPGANQIALSTNGTGRLFVNASGDVNISGRLTSSRFNTAFENNANAGTNIPLVPLSGGYSLVNLDNAGAGTNATFLRLGNVGFSPNASASWVGAYYNLNYSSNVVIYSGKKGNFTLAANNSARNAEFAQDVIIFSTGPAGTADTSERLRITSAGLVGIGTSSPNYLITANSSSAISALQFINSSTGSTASDGFLVYNNGLNAILSNEEAGDLRLQTSGQQRLTINSSGRVGIGTSTPGYLLDVRRSSAGDVVAFTGSTDGGRPLKFVSADNGIFLGAQWTRDIGSGSGIHAWAINGTERARIDSSGRLGIGTASPGYLVTAATSADGVDGVSVESPSVNGVIRLRADGTNGNAIRVGGVGAQGNTLRFLVGSDAERMRIDSSGRLLVGTSSAVQSEFVSGATNTPSFQLVGSSQDTAHLAIVRSSAAGAPTLSLNSNPTATDNGLGFINWNTLDGSVYKVSASIAAYSDATPGVNDRPSRLVFSTTSDASASPTERLRITNDGVRGYNQPAPVAVDTTATLTVANLKTGIITSTTAAAVTMTLPTGTLTEGGFSGLYNNFTFEWTVINTGATNAVTVQGDTGHTLVGSGTVAAGVSGRFASRRTAANTFVTYRLS